MPERQSITTKKGDQGRTRTAAGAELWKDAGVPEACGAMDELMSLLGVVRHGVTREDVSAALEEIQQKLFHVGAVLSGAELKKGMTAWFTEDDVADLTAKCEKLESRMEMPRGFIVPGTTPGGAHIDFARAVARRCERRIVRLAREGEIREPSLLSWMNRLSDYLWLLARLEDGSAPKPVKRLYPLNVR